MNTWRRELKALWVVLAQSQKHLWIPETTMLNSSHPKSIANEVARKSVHNGPLQKKPRGKRNGELALKNFDRRLNLSRRHRRGPDWVLYYTRGCKPIES